MVAPEPSMVGSERSFTATDLSKRTDRTSYSIPDDGRAVTIQTDRRRRRREDTQSVLSHATNTSLLIEYFENTKPGSGSTGRHPSVRVKVTPSAAKRHRVNQTADGNGVEISEVGSGDLDKDGKPGRRPTHTHRIQLSQHSGEDRLTLGQSSNHARSYSGDQSTMSSLTSGGDESNFTRGGLNVTVIRESNSPGSMLSNSRGDTDYADRRRRRRTANGTATDFHEDTYRISKQPRSRSVSRESEIYQEPGFRNKLGRRRSRSLSRERLSMTQTEKEKIEQAVRNELERTRNPKSQKDRSKSRHKPFDDGLKPSHARKRSRSRDIPLDEIAAEKVRARRKAAEIEGDNHSVVSSRNGTNPALVELIRGTIRELLLPEIEEMKANQHKGTTRPGFEGTISRNLSILSARSPERASSMPEVGKPVVVLTPDVGKNGVVISGGENDNRFEEEITNRNGPGFGIASSPFHSESGEGVSLVGAIPMGDGRLLMPHHPSRSDSPDETRLSILTAESHTGAPYPEDNGNMPSSGHTPPPGHRAPVSEFPELSELILGGSDIGGASSFLSDRSGAGQSYLSRTGLGIGAPSIASLNLLEDLNDDDRVSAASSGTRGPPTTVHPAFSELSFESMSQPTSTVLAKERKDKGRRRRSERGIDELSEIREVDGSQTSSRVNPVTLFFAEQREREQEKALSNPSYLDRSVEVRHVSTVTGGGGTFDERRLDKVNAGHPVYDIGASPSMCSTPVLGAHSAVASVLNPSHVGSALSSNNNNNSATFTNNDSFDNSRSYTNTPSNLSRPDSRPVLGSSAYPVADDPMPAYGHHHFADDDDEINTNPSIIQGPGGHHQSANWEMANGYSDRGLTMDDDEMRLTPISPQANSRLGNTPLGKDEGYISAANPIGSPGSASPVGMRGDAGMGAIDDMLSDAEFYRGQQRNRMSSGNSHGMPSPLYDSSTGRGIERIESKDIVALMEHLTVRDAQRNARDTEILVTLVRSAAEMRNSFEDMKKALADQRRDIVNDVDINTERSVQKVLQGPRPLPPSTPRKARYSKSEEDAEDEGVQRAKRASVFKRALKGLSMGSSKDLERIEEMLCKLLGEVEGLKDGQQFYAQGMTHSQTVDTINALLSPQDQIEAGPSTSFVNNSVGNSGYHSAGPSRQPSGKIYDQHHPSHLISPIQEDAVLDTSPREAPQLPLDTPPNPKMSGAAVNTPTKPTEKNAKRESGSSSLFPRISRWSETTASTGIRGFLSKGKNNQDGSDASHSQQDFNFWETEAAKGTQGELLNNSPFDSEGHRTERAGSPLVPPSLRDSDAPINQSSRISLDIQHPRPRATYNHQLEQQAQQITADGGGFIANSPVNASVSSLGNYPPLGPGGFQNGKLLSPLAQDAYAQHQAQMTPKVINIPPSRSFEDDSHDGSSTRKHKKHRERDENGEKIKKPKKERTEEEKQKRKEKKERRERERDGGASSSASRKKSRDFLSDGGTEGMSGRTPSTASRLNGPRPLSSASNKENTSRRRQHTSQTANGGYPPYPPSPSSWQSGDEN